MFNPDNFEEHVQSALAHLYDHPFLQDHPLAVALGSRVPLQDRGRLLRRLLLDAILELKPPRGTPPNSPAWQHYQYLYLRYVEVRPVAEIAEELAVSERQTRRWHHDVLATFSRILRAKLEAQDRRSAPRPECAPSTWDEPLAPGAGPSLDTELRRIRSDRASETIDLAEIVGGSVETIARLAERADVTTSVCVPAGSVLVDGDRVVLRQAVLAVLVFALRWAAGSRLEIVARPHSERPRLLVRARRSGHRTGSEVPVGDDPGLREAQELLRTQGSTLEICVAEKELAVAVTLSAAQRQNILIVDDNPDVLQLFHRHLEGSGYHVVEAKSGAEAVRLAAETRPVGVILDVLMPSRDGWETLQMLQSQPATGNLPVIVCSVLRQWELALSLGAAGFLPKPFTKEELLDALRICSRCRAQGHSG